jgi:Glycosyl transferase family group 2
LTEYDALNLDVSHVVEQQGRSAALQCFGFNGTGGIWRLAAIEAGGGWNWETVTEDLDLSYASHLAGYKFVYLRDIPQELELPTGILAHKQQKHRWTKGFWQVLRKSLWSILTRKESGFWIKLEAFVHMSFSASNPLTLLAMILVTLLSFQGVLSLFLVTYCMTPLACVVIGIVTTVYGKVSGTNGQYRSFCSRTKRLCLMPVLIIFSMGMIVYETYAMYDGLVSDDATFLRTPKEGSANTGAMDDANDQVIDNVMKNKKRSGGFVTEMILVFIGLYYQHTLLFLQCGMLHLKDSWLDRYSSLDTCYLPSDLVSFTP